MTHSQTPQGAVLLALDGVIADTSRDVAGALTTALWDDAHTEFNPDGIAPALGLGLPRLFERTVHAAGIELDAATLRARCQTFLETYHAQPASQTTLLAGAQETLESLRLGGFQIAICANCCGQTAESIVDALQLGEYVDAIVGLRRDRPAKPFLSTLLTALNRFDTRASHSVFVSGSSSELVAARSVRVPGVAYVSENRRPADEDAVSTIKNLHEIVDLANSISRQPCQVRLPWMADATSPRARDGFPSFSDKLMPSQLPVSSSRNR